MKNSTMIYIFSIIFVLGILFYNLLPTLVKIDTLFIVWIISLIGGMILEQLEKK